MKLGDQEKPWAPHKVCKKCVESLWRWTKGTREKMSFGIPVVWRKQKDHSTDCYFCAVKTSGFNKKNKSKIEYPYIPSAIRPIAHSAEIPVPVFEQLPPLEDLSNVEERSDSNDADFDIHEDPVRREFDQHELNGLARDLGLSKKASDILASRLNEKNLLEQGVKVSYFRTRESTFLQHFRSDSGFVFHHNIPGLLK